MKRHVQVDGPRTMSPSLGTVGQALALNWKADRTSSFKVGSVVCCQVKAREALPQPPTEEPLLPSSGGHSAVMWPLHKTISPNCLSPWSIHSHTGPTLPPSSQKPAVRSFSGSGHRTCPC